MAARIVDKVEKREHILSAALRVFARRGFAPATMQEIASEADIGKGTLYEYFRSKDEIIHNTWIAFMTQMQQSMDGVLDTALPAPQKLERLLQLFIDILRGEGSSVIRVIFNFWAEAMRDTSSQNIIFVEMNRYYQSYRQTMAAALRQGIRESRFRNDLDPDTVASALIGMLDGLLAQWILDPEALDFECMAGQMPGLVLRGVGVPAPDPQSTGDSLFPERRQK